MKVLIGIPIEETKLFCLDALLDSLVQMKKSFAYEILFVVNQRNSLYETISQKIRTSIAADIEPCTTVMSLDCPDNATLWNAGSFTHLVQARNRCIERAKEIDADYLFFLDADVLCPNTCIEKLLQHAESAQGEKNIFAGYYDSRFFEEYPMIGNFMRDKSIRLLHEGEDFERGEIIPCDAAGMGCVLLPRSLFEQQLFDEHVHSSEDVEYFQEAASRGYTLHIDTQLKSAHHGLGEEKLDSANRGIVNALGTALWKTIGPYFMRDAHVPDIEQIFNETPARFVVEKSTINIPLLLEDHEGIMSLLAYKNHNIHGAIPSVAYILKPKEYYRYSSQNHRSICTETLQTLRTEQPNENMHLEAFVTVKTIPR